MKEYITKESAIQAISGLDLSARDFRQAKIALEKWKIDKIRKKEYKIRYVYYCSECNSYFNNGNEYLFCPSCGAAMDYGDELNEE